MDYINSIWQIGLIALAAGALIGALAHRLLAPSAKEADRARTERDNARDELKQYKASVNQHFDTTAELVNDLTQNYVKVYRHLAEGAQTLGDSKTLHNLLEQQPGKVAIAVDEQAATGAGTPVVEPAPTPGVTPAQPNAQAETVDAADAEPSVESVPASEAAPDEPVDEHAEPYIATATGAAPDAKPANEAPSTDEDAAAGESVTAGSDPEKPDEAAKPVVNVEALEQAIEDADGPDPAKAADENREKTGVGATTH